MAPGYDEALDQSNPAVQQPGGFGPQSGTMAAKGRVLRHEVTSKLPAMGLREPARVGWPLTSMEICILIFINVSPFSQKKLDLKETLFQRTGPAVIYWALSGKPGAQ